MIVLKDAVQNLWLGLETKLSKVVGEGIFLGLKLLLV